LKEEDYTPWRVWWDHFGKHLPEKENAEGVKDIEAWQVACRRRRRLPIPDELLYLPSSYRVVFSFRSGDYQGKVREDMILTRSPEAAELRRTFSTITDGPVQTQYWANFSIDKADMVTRAILYVIDHPWLTLDEDRINREYAAHPRPGERDDKWFSLPKTPKIPGRESFSNYYPSATFQIEDSDGRILANDDPRGFWDGGNHDRFNHGDPVGGSLIYAFFTKLFPENTISSVDEVEGWRDVQ
jgi:hypothetical protein